MNNGLTGVPMLGRDLPEGIELGIRNYWYPVLASEDVPSGKPFGFKALGEDLVAWRDSKGEPHVARDRCPHRAARFSAGRVIADDLQCAWHGLRFDSKGNCTLIPWEADESELRGKVQIAAYPTGERAGYIWAYMSDGKPFPVPLLDDCLPEEFVNPQGFISFRHKVHIWNCNWLQALDGSDGYHAVMLHSQSQGVASEPWTGGELKKAAIPLERRRMKIIETTQGLRSVGVDSNGKEIHHGHLLEGWKGERWTLPCLYSIPTVPGTQTGTIVVRLYQVPVDATHCRTFRTISMRATTDEDRARCTKLWNEALLPRQLVVSAEDQAICESLGDLAESRANEFLFNSDRDVLSVRRMMADAFMSQLSGKRPLPTRSALVYSAPDARELKYAAQV